MRMTGGKVRELNERAALRLALQAARDYTLAVYAHLDHGQRQFPYLRVVNPPVFLGPVAGKPDRS